MYDINKIFKTECFIYIYLIKFESNDFRKILLKATNLYTFEWFIRFEYFDVVTSADTVAKWQTGRWGGRTNLSTMAVALN